MKFMNDQEWGIQHRLGTVSFDRAGEPIWIGHWRPEAVIIDDNIRVRGVFDQHPDSVMGRDAAVKKSAQEDDANIARLGIQVDISGVREATDALNALALAADAAKIAVRNISTDPNQIKREIAMEMVENIRKATGR